MRDEDAALDVVQEAMLKLASKYAHKVPEELPMLFQRILQNTIRDHMRRSRVRNLWTTLLSTFGREDDEDADPLDTLEVSEESATRLALGPQAQVEQAQTLAIIEEEISRLPPRQREAFLMRYWEEMDTAETAAAMGCTEGSVKTHCSRATHTLADALRKRGIVL